jgi:glutamate synthase (NADPH/NADH) small chain
VGIRGETRIGRDITIEQLRAEHDAVLPAVSLHLDRSAPIPNRDHADVVSAAELLRCITPGPEPRGLWALSDRRSNGGRVLS